jgi:hypothetical protein
MSRREQFGGSPEYTDAENSAFNANDTFDGAFLGLGLAARLSPFTCHKRAG